MAIVIPTLVVIGIALFTHGLFDVLWGDKPDRVIGRVLIALSVASLGVGILGTLSVLTAAAAQMSR